MLLSYFIVFALVRGYNGLDDLERLPDDTEPESYALRLAPNLDTANASFTGQVDILIRVKTTTTVVTLNAKDLVLCNITVTDEKTDRNIEVDSWAYTKDREQVQILLRNHVLANRKYTISIRFRGLLRDDATGFFKTFFMSASGEKKWLAATQFKTTHARSAFPCYDEPNFRTTFKISIKKKSNEIALSNMPISINVDEDEKITGNQGSKHQNGTWVHFEQTPPISTCLVAFVVGEFEKIESDRQNLINVYSHLGSLYQIEYINNEAPRLLEVMENYTGIKYNLTKLDLLAVPELGLSAMENWGLNTYRERSLFVDKNTKTKTKVSVKMLVEHVMAHQWFGNLVTPAWWGFTWLDEGFATYFEYFATATLEPEWRLEHFFVVERQRTALEFDQTPRRALSASVHTPEEIAGVFDQISYDKGAAILRMLRDWIGEESFKNALNVYLIRNRYGIVKPVHLWNAFDNALFGSTSSSLQNESIHTYMNSWTNQPGYPVINVKKNEKSLVLTQKRFLMGSSDGTDPTKWYIRSSYTTNVAKDFDTESTPSVWLDPSVNETTVRVADDVEWYIFNIQSTGFYRVNYTEDNWLSLAKQLNDTPEDVHVINRAQIIDDSFNLARAGQLNYSIPLSMTRYLEKENDIIPWLSVMNNFNYVLDRMRRSEGDGYVDVKDFVGKLAGMAFEKVNKLVAEPQKVQHPVKIGWNAFSTWACKLDNEDCIKTALNYFRRWQYGEEIPADIKDAAFCTGIKHGARNKDWTKMLDLYKSTKTYSEKESALNALACTENVQLLVTYLEKILDDECPIGPNDYKAFFHALSTTPSGITALTLFLRNNLLDIVNDVKDGENIVTTIYTILASKVSTEQEIAKLSEVTTELVKFKKKFYQICNDEIEYNKKWFDMNSKTIREFINPGSTVTLEPTTTTTTQNPSKHGSNASSRLHNFMIILQTLALSLSVKLFVNKS